MTDSVLPAVDSSSGAVTRSDVAVEALARARRQRREEAAALVRLVEQVTTAEAKGRHVDYYA